MASAEVLEQQLIGDIYDAALRPALWAPIIDAIVRLVGAEQGNLLAYDQLNPDYFLFHSSGTRPEALQLYQEGGFAPLDKEFTYRWAGEPGRVVANHEAFGSIEAFKQEAGRFYSEFMVHAGILYQAGSILEKEEFRWAVIGMHRSEDGQPFEGAPLELLSRLVPHVRRSLQIYRQVAQLQQANTHLYRILDGIRAAVLLLDAHGRLRYANRAAEHLLAANSCLRVTAHHQLVATAAADDALLQQALTDARLASNRDRHARQGGAMLALPRREQRSPLMLTVAPLSELAGYQELGRDGIVTALFISDPESGRHLAREHLQDAYRLSEREIDICQAFLDIPSTSSVAERCGIADSTLRTYLKSIYEKTGRHSQAELMRLLMGLTTDFTHIR